MMGLVDAQKNKVCIVTILLLFPQLVGRIYFCDWVYKLTCVEAFLRFNYSGLLLGFQISLLIFLNIRKILVMWTFFQRHKSSLLIKKRIMGVFL